MPIRTTITGLRKSDSLKALLDQTCSQYSSSVALLSHGQQPLTYAQLAVQLEAVRSVCHQAGIRGDGRVGVLLPQGPENAVICLALMTFAGCVPLNPDASMPELMSQIDRLGLVGMITRREQLAQFDGDKLALLVVAVDQGLRAGECHLSIVRSASRERNVTRLVSVPLLLQTSGSTAMPKIVPLNTVNLLASCEHLIHSLALSSDDRCLNMMPQFHIGALLDLLLAPLLMGGSVVVCRDMKTETFFDMLAKYQPSWYQGVPAMLANLLQYGERQQLSLAPNKLRFLRVVSAALSHDLHQQLVDYFAVPVVEIYGMTETAGVIASNSLQTEGQKPGSVGVSAGPEIAVLDSAGNAARAGVRGEIVVRGDNVFDGYELPGTGLDRSTCFVGDWLRTGDEGYLDEEGNLYLSGRLKDVINRGGEKIAPQEVDQCLLAHPSVVDAACFALPHTSLGEDIYAVVVSRDNLNEESLRRFLMQKLASFKVPHHILFVDDIPRTVGGKLQRHMLASLYGENQGQVEQGSRVPTTDMEQLLARMWREILQLPVVYADDDFFDLGGDSLKAATFLIELEQHLHISLESGLLFDHPTLCQLAARLEHGQELGGEQNTVGSLYLPKPLFEQLLRLMSSWSGQRSHGQSLIVGRNRLGHEPPVFWSTSDQDHFDALAHELTTNQPIYGMRTLFPLHERNAHNNYLLVQHLVDEIKIIQPTGPYYLGGYCEGGKIVSAISRMLREQGDEVALLYVVDYRVSDPQDVRMAMLLSDRSHWSPVVCFSHPERGWAKILTDNVSLKVVDFRHREFMAPEGIKEMTSHLMEELKAVRSGLPSPYAVSLPVIDNPQRLSPSACQGVITGVVGRWLSPDQSLTLRVTVTNQGDCVWLPYDQSGVLLAARWRRNHTQRVKIWQAGCAPLPEKLSPGDHLDLVLEIQVPKKWGGWTLELDLCDEGLCFFEEHGSQPLCLPVTVMPGVSWLNHLSVGRREN